MPATATARPVLVREKVWPHIGYEPHVGQRRIHASKARIKVVPAGRRFGKSQLGGHELTAECLFTSTVADALRGSGRRREFWIVGPEYSDAEKEFRVLWNDLERLEVPLDRPGSYNNPEAGDLHVSAFDGAFQVHAKSAKYPTTLVGEGLSGVVLAEAAKLKEKVWTKFIRPTLADFRGWAIMTSTPEGKNWFHKAYQRGLDPDDTEWESFRMPSWMNPFVFPAGASPEALALLRRMQSPQSEADRRITPADIIAAGMDQEIVDMAKDMSTERFNQEIAADFSDFVGRVFKDFDEEVHVGNLSFDPARKTFACCDYGWTHPFVWLIVQVDVFDNIYVLAEYRAQQKDINDIGDDLKGMAVNGLIQGFYPDPASPGDTAVLEKKLKKKSLGGGGGELKWRLELIRQALKIRPEHGPIEDRKPRLMIDRSCRELIREMQDYRFPDTKEEQGKHPSEKPMDLDDHGPEALGRFFRGYYGGPSDGRSTRPRQKKAKFG